VAPVTLETARLVLRRPRRDDAPVIFDRYATDPEVTRFVAWPRHQLLEDTRAFVEWSEAEWERWGVGPYLIWSRQDVLLGSTGLAPETARRSGTGFVLARDSWGCGYATEALESMVSLAQALAVVRLYAVCHVDHRASARVLEKCGFEREGILRRYAEFPNLAPGHRADVLCYARTFEGRVR
jgi:RimJ/RimL family protein N-acetyltransferase